MMALALNNQQRLIWLNKEIETSNDFDIIVLDK